MQTVNTVAEAIARSRQRDEIVSITVIDLAAAIREAEGVAADSDEHTDWADDATRENGAKVVSMWGWSEESEHQESWRIEIVARI